MMVKNDYFNNLLSCREREDHITEVCTDLDKMTSQYEKWHDFNPCRCSLLQIVTFDTVIPAVVRSLTSYPYVVLGLILHYSQDHVPHEIISGMESQVKVISKLIFIKFLIIAP